MTKLQIWIDSIAAAVGAALGFLFGEASGLFLALLAFMALDYISGVLVAIGNKKLSSKVGAKGIAKKTAGADFYCDRAYNRYLFAVGSTGGNVGGNAVLYRK